MARRRTAFSSSGEVPLGLSCRTRHTRWTLGTGFRACALPLSSSLADCEGAQAGSGPFDAFDIPTVAVAVTLFPAEIYRAPKSWGEKSFGNLIYWNEVDRGGHFAAWEQPQLFSEEVRAAFRSLRD